jgi:outer membrane beta-barrel protein
MSKSSFVLLILLLGCWTAFAEDIEFPEEELARETVLPVFDKRRVVLNRNIVTLKRLELGLGAGLEMNEPYYNDTMVTAQGTYNYSETSAINVQGLYWMDGLSSYGEQLKAGTKISCGSPPCGTVHFDAMKAPHPRFGLFANYQFVAYYGKISVSKQTVMNLNLFGLAGLGYINMDQTGGVALNIGAGQNLFFTKNVGLRLDLRYLIFQGPNATTKSLESYDNPAPSSFGNRIYYNAQIGASLIFIL